MSAYPSTLQNKARKATRAKEGGKASFSIPFLNKIAQKKVIDFTRGLAVMIKARIGLVDALDTAIKQQSDESLTHVLKAIRKDIKRGKSLATSMSKHPACFDELYTHLVEVGEMAGVLDDILLRLADYKEKSHRLKLKIRTAMVYPAIILSVAAAAVTFLLTVVVPTFVDMYQDFDAELPGPTKVILAISEFLSGNILWILIGLIGLGILLRWLFTKDATRTNLEKLLLKVPYIGELFQKTLIARFTKTLATLLQSGITLTDSLSILKKSSGSKLLNTEITQLLSSVKKGGSLTKTMSKSVIFPEMVGQMITVGEETANLDDMLHQVADHYEGEVDIMVEGLTSIIEPVLIVVIGLLLGGIIVALYLPIFELVNVVG